MNDMPNIEKYSTLIEIARGLHDDAVVDVKIEPPVEDEPENLEEEAFRQYQESIFDDGEPDEIPSEVQPPIDEG